SPCGGTRRNRERRSNRPARTIWPRAGPELEPPTRRAKARGRRRALRISLNIAELAPAGIASAFPSPWRRAGGARTGLRECVLGVNREGKRWVFVTKRTRRGRAQRRREKNHRVSVPPMPCAQQQNILKMLNAGRTWFSAVTVVTNVVPGSCDLPSANHRLP